MVCTHGKGSCFARASSEELQCPTSPQSGARIPRAISLRRRSDSCCFLVWSLVLRKIAGERWKLNDRTQGIGSQTDRGFRELEFDAEAAEHGPKASGAGVERRFAFALLRRGAPFFSNLRSFATERPFKSAHLSPPIRLHPIPAIF